MRTPRVLALAGFAAATIAGVAAFLGPIDTRASDAICVASQLVIKSSRGEFPELHALVSELTGSDTLNFDHRLEYSGRPYVQPLMIQWLPSDLDVVTVSGTFRHSDSNRDHGTDVYYEGSELTDESLEVFRTIHEFVMEKGRAIGDDSHAIQGVNGKLTISAHTGNAPVGRSLKFEWNGQMDCRGQ